MIYKKRGITLSSLVIYIVLFTSFTLFASNVSSNMNERLLKNRGEAINYTSLNKLQYNIDASSSESTSVTVTENEIVFSNNDKYVYDSENKVVLKNDGILCQNIDSFSVELEEKENAQKVTIQVELSKYLNAISKSIITCVEVD